MEGRAKRSKRTPIDYAIFDEDGFDAEFFTEKTDHDKEKQRIVKDKIINRIEEGMKIVQFPDKGRGVVTSREFTRGEFIVEYAGDLIDIKTAKQKEQEYNNDHNIGCYMFYFKYKSIKLCIDATEESGRLGRLINHSRTNYNCQMKLTDINDRPHLMLVASRDIAVGEELLYDYGDRDRESLSSHPWLKS